MSSEPRYSSAISPGGNVLLIIASFAYGEGTDYIEIWNRNSSSDEFRKKGVIFDPDEAGNSSSSENAAFGVGSKVSEDGTVLVIGRSRRASEKGFLLYELKPKGLEFVKSLPYSGWLGQQDLAAILYNENAGAGLVVEVFENHDLYCGKVVLKTARSQDGVWSDIPITEEY